MTETPQAKLVERVSYLRRRYHPHLRVARGRIDPVPLVNVVLLLVLFSLLNAPFVLQPGVTVDLPVAPFADGVGYGPAVVTLSQEGMVFFNDERTSLDALPAALALAVADHPQASLVIEADGRVAHNAIVQVCNMATAAGIRKVVLATRVGPVGGGL